MHAVTSAVVSASASASPSAAPVVTSATAPTFDPDAPPVTISLRSPKVGDKAHDRITLHSELDGSAVVKTFHMTSDDEMERDSEVLAVTDGRVTKLRLTYTKVKRARTVDGESKPSPGPVEGRAYLVERPAEADALRIVAADGKPVSEPEAAEIRSGMSSFGKVDLVVRALASKARRPGEKLDDVAKAMKERYDADAREGQKPGDHSEIGDITVTFSGTESISGTDTALLEVHSKITGVRDGADMTLETKGTTAFKIDGGSLVRTRADGLSTMKKGLVSGSGHMILEARTAPLGAR